MGGHDREQKVKEFWNGHVISDITGLEGKELGQFMAHFKGSLEALVEDHFAQWVLTPNADEYRINTVREAARRWKNERA